MKWISLLALATVAVAATQDGSLLRRALTVGTEESYKIDSVLKLVVESPQGEMDLNVTTLATVAIKPTKLDAEKGIADIESVTKLEKFSMEGALTQFIGTGPEKLPDAKSEKGTLDSRNRLVIPPDPKAKPATMGMPDPSDLGAMALLALVELPEKPLKIGDTLEMGVPAAASMATLGTKDQKITMKLVGEKSVDGKNFWVVSFSGNLKIDFDSSKLPKKEGEEASPMGDVKIVGTGTVTGDGLVDKATCRTSSNTLNFKTDTKVSVAGMEIPSKGTVVMKTSLVK
jgi:hypothetical protein